MNDLTKLGIGAGIATGAGAVLAGVPGLIICGGAFILVVVATSLKK